METYSTLIWKIIGAIAVLWIAQKLVSLFNPPAIANQPTTAATTNRPITTPQLKTNTPVVQSNQVISSNNTPTKVATPEKKEVFVFPKEAKDRERNLDERKRALTEKARGNMLNKMSEKAQVQQMPVANNMAFSSPVITSPVRAEPIVSSPNITSPKASIPVVGELCNPVPLEQQLLNSNLSKSTPSSLNRPVVEEKKPAKSLTQSQSPSRTRKEKPAEEGLCLQTGEIKPITAKTSVEEDRETKRRRAIEAFELNKNKNL